MTLFIIHYHLNPGGVTRIVQSQIQSLLAIDPTLSIVVLTGGCADTKVYTELGAEVIVEPKLNYLSADLDEAELNAEYNAILKLLQQQIQQGDIVHFHNYGLGKNPLLTLAVYTMAQQGLHVLDHCHDFAEDRPKNYRFLAEIIHDVFGYDLLQVLYPDLSNFYYSTLNSFDLDRIIGFGVNKAKSFLFPNPVALPNIELSKPDKARKVVVKALGLDPVKKIFTYPVRVIERKNIGEYILLACLFADRANWVVTLPPQNPIELAMYQQWKSFCAEQSIELCFEAGLNVGFEDMITATDACITTSVREGFGMVYLEPWLMGTPVMGRDISYVTKDIVGSGIQFPLLYEQIAVEHQGVTVDFASLDMDQQMATIAAIKQDKALMTAVKSNNLFLEAFFQSTNKEQILHNQQVIINTYSLKKYGERLHVTYKKLVG